MRIGFLENQIGERGTTIQSYLYAKYARLLLGHSTIMLYPDVRYMYEDSKWTREKRIWLSSFSSRHRRRNEVLYHAGMAEKITRDGVELAQVSLERDFSEFDAIHHSKPGKKDYFHPKGTRYWVHAVTDASQPHGDRYAANSKWLGNQFGVPFVPRMIDCSNDSKNLRHELGIPPDGIVFGRYGGRDTFNLPWAWEAIAQSLTQSENIFFLFCNTDLKFCHERIFGLPTIYDSVQKRRFVNTCDAMLHARDTGESFGAAVGEFAVCGKPVLTYAKSRERAHIEMLSNPICYNDVVELKRAIEIVASGDARCEDGGAYRECTPEKVMKIFEEVFIR